MSKNCSNCAGELTLEVELEFGICVDCIELLSAAPQPTVNRFVGFTLAEAPHAA